MSDFDEDVLTDCSQVLESNSLADASDLTDHAVPTATLQIYQFIQEYLARSPDTHINRASSAPTCYKKRWYQRNGYVGTQMGARARVNFLLGDLTEYSLKYFVLKGCVGPGRLYSEIKYGNKIGSFTVQGGKEIEMHEQEDLTAQIGPYTFTAHVDGWGKRNLDGKWELIEFKSSSNSGFRNFVGQKGAGDYLKQSTVNLLTTKAKELGADGVRYFYIRKETGHTWDKYYPFDPALAKVVEQEANLANQEVEPEAPYSPIIEIKYKKATGRAVLPWQCSYCPYTTRCHPSANLEFKSGKPVYVVKQKEIA